MRVVFAGTPEVALPSLQALLDSRHDVVAVLTRPDAPVGRGRALHPSPVARLAHDAGLEVLKPTSVNAPETIARLRQLTPDVCPVVAYGALLGEELLTVPRLGWVNLHFSLLPRWRGAAPVQHAIMAGDDVTGTTCFRIVRQLDAGDVIRRQEVPMPELTAGEVLAQLAASGASQLIDAIDALEAGEEPVPQTDEGATYASKITTASARIDFKQPAEQVNNLVLGCSPDPGAWCEWEGNRFKVYRSRVARPATAETLAPGRLHVTRKQVFVGTADHDLELLEVQAPGRKRMNAIDWARGAASGTVLS